MFGENEFVVSSENEVAHDVVQLSHKQQKKILSVDVFECFNVSLIVCLCV